MRWTATIATVCLLASNAFSHDGHNLTEEEIGSVHFLTSCANLPAGSFDRGVALLHSFQYEQARAAFQDLTTRDSHCAMAQWGIAMSHYHGLWNNGDTNAGRAALQNAQRIAASNTRTTQREKAYINALAEIYREEGDKTSHAQAFERSMGSLQAAYPADTEAAVFHALSLDIAAPKTDITFSNQRKCGEILEPIFRQQPHHPGVAHYLIHCYDNPVLAEHGLAAARAYAKIAPASAHANHMPSHIFTRVGLWDESIQSNQRSAELAVAAEGTSKNGEARDQRLHAMDYMEYAFLQRGLIARSAAVLAETKSLNEVQGTTLTSDYALAAIPARYTIELRDWVGASALEPRGSSVAWAQAITWAAIGIGSARSGRLDQAHQAEEKLASLREITAKQNQPYWAKQVEVERLEVAAWILQQSSKPADAITTMLSAVRLEESMDKDAVTPGAVTPSREMLAEMLLADQKPAEALADYQAVLNVAPKRFNALYGAILAADKIGDHTSAKKYFSSLMEMAGEGERPEMTSLRKQFAAQTSSSSGTK